MKAWNVYANVGTPPQDVVAQSQAVAGKSDVCIFHELCTHGRLWHSHRP